MRSRGVIVAEDHAEAGEVYEVGHTVRFGSGNTLNLRPAPALGQHTLQILRELGRSDREIDELIESKVVNAAGARGSSKAAEKHA